MTDTGIRIDFNNCMAARIGKAGLTDKELATAAARARRAFKAVARARKRKKLAWAELPHERETLEKIHESWEAKREAFDDIVVLGIGGSALGAICLRSALLHPEHNRLGVKDRDGPGLHVLDNVDPNQVGGLLDTLNLKRTLFLVVTKSGGTAETMAQFLLARERVKRMAGKTWRERFVCVTGEAGALSKIAAKEKFETLPVPEGVGGRFSVLSTVGLYPAVAAGIDAEKLLDGAAAMDAACASPEMSENPALANAALLWLFAKKRKCNVHVMMPYAHALRDVADWYRQLWAESLGKRVDRKGKVVNAGQTPVKALGVTDQHSQVQLYVEGPYDKLVTFVAVEKFDHYVRIPRAYERVEAAAYLGGRAFGDLLEAERRGTELALSSAGRPNETIWLAGVTPRTVGALLYMLELQTAYAGEMYEVNAFDQPGVEAGKVATCALMGRKGFDKERKRIEKARAPEAKYVVGGDAGR